MVSILCGFMGAQAQTRETSPEPDSPASRAKILNADILSFRREGGVELQRLLGNVKILQDSTYFYCDSAYYFETDNRIEAFGRVRIEMPDSVVMVAKRATYDGKTRIAEAYDKIVLTDKSVQLTTDRLTFDRTLNYGYYQEGGKLIDGDTDLTSIIGSYYPDEDMAYFRQDVILVSPDYTLSTDTLAYNTETKVATFLTYTLIQNKDGDIETTSGNYDINAKRINLFARSQVKDSTYIMTGDTLFYDDETSMGFATGRVVVDQQDSTLQVKGNYGEFYRGQDMSLVTDNPVAIQVFDNDTLFLFADTLRSFSNERIDTIRFQYQLDSLTTVDSMRIDTHKVRIFRGYHNVRFYMRELQGKCDSLVYFYDDSLLYMYQQPMLWSQENQLSGDTVKVWMKEGEADSMWIGPNAFLVSEEDTVGFNQIKGKEMRASFIEGDISRLEVLGNSESIYFAKEEDSTKSSYQGMNQALSQRMNFYFEDNEIIKIVFLAKPEGTFKPMFEVLFKENKLEGMNWLPTLRPLRPDVIQIMLGPWPPLPDSTEEIPALLPLEDSEITEMIDELPEDSEQEIKHEEPLEVPENPASSSMEAIIKEEVSTPKTTDR